MTTPQTPEPHGRRILRALHRLAVAMGHTVPAERMATLVRDLSPYEWADIIAALDAHRKVSAFYPQIADLRPFLHPMMAATSTAAGLRGRSGWSSWSHPVHRSPNVAVVDPDYHGHPYRFFCSHAPTCRTWPQCRDLNLAHTDLDALNAAYRARHDRGDR